MPKAKITAVFLLSTCLAGPMSAHAFSWENGDYKINLRGSLRLSVNHDDCEATGCPTPQRPDVKLTDQSDTYMSGNFSHIQVDGSKKFGNGMTGVFKSEWKFDPTVSGDSDSFTDFEQYLGVKGGFGMVRAGTILTPYMQSGVKLDPFRRDALAGRFFIDIYSALHHTNGKGRGRSTNTIRYDSPKFLEAISAQLFLGIDGTSENDESQDDHSFGGGAIYNKGPAYAFVQYYNNGEPGDDVAYKLGGSYKFGSATIHAQYEIDGGLISLSEGLVPGVSPKGDLNFEGNTVDGADVWLIGANYKWDKALLIAQYGQRKDSSAAEDGHGSWIVGASYHLDKDFYLYTGYLSKDHNANARGTDSRVTAGGTYIF